jgi:hypothetical protein
VITGVVAGTKAAVSGVALGGFGVGKVPGLVGVADCGVDAGAGVGLGVGVAAGVGDFSGVGAVFCVWPHTVTAAKLKITRLRIIFGYLS